VGQGPNSNSRRNFLRSGLIAISTATLAGEASVDRSDFRTENKYANLNYLELLSECWESKQSSRVGRFGNVGGAASAQRVGFESRRRLPLLLFREG
jgi:hypothetical protein